MAADRTQLVEAALRLRAASPGAWEEFLQAMRNYQAQMVGEMVKCDVTMLVKAQGMAQMMTELTATLQQAPQIKQKMEDNRNGRRPEQTYS
jgi:hypothetical protein